MYGDDPKTVRITLYGRGIFEELEKDLELG